MYVSLALDVVCLAFQKLDDMFTVPLLVLRVKGNPNS